MKINMARAVIHAALAHGIGGRVDLPVPRWLFVFGAATVLVVSFALLGALWREPRFPRPTPVGRDSLVQSLLRSGALAWLVRAIGLAWFLVVAVAGWRGLRALLALGLTQVVLWSSFAPLISLPSSFLGGSAAAGGIALVVSIGQVGSFIGSTLIGVLRERTGDYGAAMAAIGIILALATLIALWLGRALSGRQQAPQAQASRAH